MATKYIPSPIIRRKNVDGETIARIYRGPFYADFNNAGDYIDGSFVINSDMVPKMIKHYKASLKAERG